MANVKVRYIGSKPVKKDTVAHTLTVWYGENSVAEVSEEVAAQLFQHPTVWQPADKPVIERPVVNTIPETPPPAGDEGQEGDDQTGGDEGEGDTDDSTGGSVGTAEPVTPEEITVILPMLDKDTDFTEAGRPMVNKVREHFEGREVTLQALKAAWENFKAVE